MMILKILLFGCITYVSFGLECCDYCCPGSQEQDIPNEKQDKKSPFGNKHQQYENSGIPQTNNYTNKTESPTSYNFDTIIDLNGKTEDLKNIFIQLMVKRYRSCLNEPTIDVAASKEEIFYYQNFQNENEINSAKEEMKKASQNIIKRFFENIIFIKREKFDKINDKTTKLLATLFLTDDDYYEYIDECKKAENDNNTDSTKKNY